MTGATWQMSLLALEGDKTSVFSWGTTLLAYAQVILRLIMSRERESALFLVCEVRVCSSRVALQGRERERESARFLSMWGMGL